MDKLRTTIRLDPILVKQLKVRAKQEHRSLNSYLEYVLNRHVYDVQTIENVLEAYRRLPEAPAGKKQKLSS